MAPLMVAQVLLMSVLGDLNASWSLRSAIKEHRKVDLATVLDLDHPPKPKAILYWYVSSQ
jgi:hypothetical protein